MATKQHQVKLGFIGTVASSFRRSTAVVDSELKRVGSVIDKVRGRQAALRKEMDKQKKAGVVDPRLIQRYKQLGSTIDQLGGKVDELKRKQKSLADTGQVLGSMWSTVRNGALGFARIGLTAVVAGATAAAVAIGGLLSSGSRWSIDLDRNARRLGTSATALQELRVAAAGFGIEAATLDDGLADMAERIGEALAEPEGSVADTLRRIGVNAQQLRGMRIEDQLAVVGDALRGLESDEARLFNARELASDTGADAILALTREGSAGLRRLREQARAGVVSDASQKQLREYAGAWGAVSVRVEALGHTIAAGLAPVATRTLKKIQEWIDGIDTDALVTNVTAFAEGIGAMGDEFGAMFGPLFSDINRVAQSFGGWGTIAKVTGLLVGAAFVGIGVTIRDFLAIFISVHDAAQWVGQAAAVVYYSWQDTFRNIGRGAQRAWGMVTSGVQLLRDRATAVVERVRGAFASAWAGISAGAAVAMAQVVTHVARVGDVIAQVMRFGRDPETPTQAPGTSPTAKAAAGVAAADRRSSSVTNNQSIALTVNAPQAQSPQQLAPLIARELQRTLVTTGAGALSDG